MENRTQLSAKLTSKATSAKLRYNLSHYVWGFIGIWFVFLATFGLAYWQVSNSDRYRNGTPTKSLSWEDNQRPKISYPR